MRKQRDCDARKKFFMEHGKTLIDGNVVQLHESEI